MYPLKVAVAAVMSEHLTLAGPVEALVTFLGYKFVSTTYPNILSEKIVAGEDWGV
jgi:cobalt/nickel transport system permease protein